MSRYCPRGALVLSVRLNLRLGAGLWSADSEGPPFHPEGEACRSHRPRVVPGQNGSKRDPRCSQAQLLLSLGTSPLELAAWAAEACRSISEQQLRARNMRYPEQWFR